ncbi:hypothetical protein [uncultured Azohydromonas sp.]|uniref:hypothetical protein n=1 Tax=uncultured Azohydromonas sp. TaxID=487342 RepID=UPI002630B454|nr:hypothetical protein [uncultured Azohydromonas sp.]
MVDGYVEGGTVFCDLDKDGVLDSGEPSTTTDANGKFAVHYCEAPLVGFGGKNTDTGFDFTGVMKAPAQSQYLTPLTTLIVEGVKEETLVALLGLPPGTKLTATDPTTNLAVYTATLAVQQYIAQLAATLAGDADPQAFYAKVALSLATVLKNAPAGTTLISASGLNSTLLEEAAKSAAGSAIDLANLKAVLADIKGQADQFLRAASLDALTTLSKALQDPAVKIDPAAGTKFFALQDDSIQFGAESKTLAELGSGITLSNFDKISLKAVVTGAPTVGTSAVGLSLVEQGGQNRALQVVLDKVNFTLSAGQLAMTVASDANIHLHGKKANGGTVSYTGPLGTIQKPVTVTDNTLTLDYSAMVKKALETATDENKPTLESYLNVTGTFQVTAAISNFNLRKADGGALAQTVVSVPNTTGNVAGAGFTGKVTVLAN